MAMASNFSKGPFLTVELDISVLVPIVRVLLSGFGDSVTGDGGIYLPSF